MPRTTGVDILSIKPDSSMGLAQDISIPVPAVALDQVNKAVQDMRLYDHQRQLMKYEHQLKQRDNLLKGLDAGEISVKQMLPEDRDAFNKATQKVREKFLAVTNEEPDTKGQNVKLADWKDAQQELEDLSVMLQHRYVEITKKRTARAATNLPSEQAALDKDIQASINADKMEPVRPFQKPFTRNFDDILAAGLTGALITADGKPLKELAPASKIGKTSITGEIKNGEIPPVVATEPDAYLSDATVYRNIENKYNNPNEEAFRLNVEKTFEDYQFSNDQILQNHILLANTRLAQKDEEMGIPSIKIYGTDTTVPGSDTGEYPSQINYRMVGDKMVIDETSVSFAAKMAIAFAPVEKYVVKGKKVWNKDAAEFQLKEAESKAKINAINALALQRKASAALTNQKSKAIDQQYNPAQTFSELFKGKMKTSQGSTLPYVNIRDMSKAFVDNLGIDPATDDGDFKIVPTNVKFMGKSIPEEEVQKMYAGWLTTPSGKNLESQLGKTPDIFDFMFANGATFDTPEVLGRIKPLYSKTKVGLDGKPLLLNADEAGKPIRSNILQSWINQRGEMKVSGNKLIMEDSESNDNIEQQ